MRNPSAASNNASLNSLLMPRTAAAKAHRHGLTRRTQCTHRTACSRAVVARAEKNATTTQERSQPAETSARTPSGSVQLAAGGQNAATFVNAGATLAICCAAFSIIAFDVNSSSSLHLLQPLDSAVHGAVFSNVSLDARIFADRLLSDTPIEAGVVASWLCLAAIAVKSPRTAALTASAAAALNVLGVGVGKDASLTLALKNFFCRPRPTSDFHQAFSFPSGHSTSVYAVTGLLFLVMLPTLNAVVQQECQTEGASETSRQRDLLRRVAQPRVGFALTFAGGSITQAGRLLADVHWASDTLAGALWVGSPPMCIGVLTAWPGPMICSRLG